MKPPCGRYLVFSLLLFAIVIASPWVGPAPAGTADKKAKIKPEAAVENGEAAKACLKCHGPFEQLASAPPGFVTKNGEKVNPHRYVPHDLKEIPDCTSCHRPHPLPPDEREIAKLSKPNVDTCYSCHHAENFTPCKSCHDRQK